jgi:hypothetical protein
MTDQPQILDTSAHIDTGVATTDAPTATSDEALAVGGAPTIEAPRGRRPWLIIGLAGALVVALIFAAVGLGVGLTKGSPAADTRRVTQLNAELIDARHSRSDAVTTAHDVATKAEAYQTLYTQMSSLAEQIKNLTQQLHAAALAGNAALVNQLLPQLGAVLDAHNAVSAQLSTLPRP